MKLEEEKLSQTLKSGELYRVYYFYGDEIFLTETYTGRVLDKVIGKDRNDINITRFQGTFSVDALADSVESMPLFAMNKAVIINDLDMEKYSDTDCDRISDILSDVPDECTVIISMTGISPGSGKKSAGKNLLAKLTKQKNCAVCEFTQLQPNKTAELIIKKAAKNGCVISRTNALYIVNITLNNLTLCSTETQKLCDYQQSGEITKETIDALVIKHPDTSIYTLATAITKGNRTEAFTILDDLFAQRIDPFIILATLSSTYIDFYRAVIARSAKKTQNDCVNDFAYPKNRAFTVGKAFTATQRLSSEYVRYCIKNLADADYKMKTSSADARTVLEQTVVLLFDEKAAV